jgi:hypothetical protein
MKKPPSIAIMAILNDGHATKTTMHTQMPVIAFFDKKYLEQIQIYIADRRLIADEIDNEMKK